MVKKVTRHAAEHPAIQNLRRFLREYLESSPRHSLADFAPKLGKTPGELGRYLRGECNPRRKLVEYWAEQFGISYEEMMIVDFEYIEYPFIRNSLPHKSGRHVTKAETRSNHDAMTEEIRSFLCEDISEDRLNGVMEIIHKHRI